MSLKAELIAETEAVAVNNDHKVLLALWLLDMQHSLEVCNERSIAVCFFL